MLSPRLRAVAAELPVQLVELELDFLQPLEQPSTRCLRLCGCGFCGVFCCSGFCGCACCSFRLLRLPRLRQRLLRLRLLRASALARLGQLRLLLLKRLCERLHAGAWLTIHGRQHHGT